MYANITLFFYMCKQIAKIFHIAGIYFPIFLHISKIMLIFVVNFLGVMLVIIFVSMVLVVVKRWAFFIVLQLHILSILFIILIMILLIQCIIQIVADDYIGARVKVDIEINYKLDDEGKLVLIDNDTIPDIDKYFDKKRDNIVGDNS